MATKPRTNGRRNRNAGKAWELEIIKLLKEFDLYPHACSTRSESRTLDGCGIDVMNRNEGVNGLMVDSIQAKTEARTVPYPKLLDRIRQAGRSHPVVFHKQTSRAGSKFMERDRFAICYMETYIEGMKARKILTDLLSHPSVLEKVPVDLRQRISTLLNK